MTFASFEYKSLPGPRFIRVLRIPTLNDKESEDSPLVGALIAGSVDDNMFMYNALSYAWEGQPSDQMLLLQTSVGNFGSCLITKNCYDALRHIRKRTKLLVGDSFYIWIDAICINQSNMTERSSQVSIMGDVYRNSQAVYIWLGLSFDNSTEAMESLDRLSKEEISREQVNHGRRLLALKAMLII
jgi:hypothetical protein